LFGEEKPTFASFILCASLSKSLPIWASILDMLRNLITNHGIQKPRTES
jgi:hypothetical protein